LLIANDDTVTLNILAQIAMKIGIEGSHIFMAEDGREAVELFKKYGPHAIIMDLNMPHMDGV
jgi:YesN/AraC family two-component response regulator